MLYQPETASHWLLLYLCSALTCFQQGPLLKFLFAVLNATIVTNYFKQTSDDMNILGTTGWFSLNDTLSPPQEEEEAREPEEDSVKEETEEQELLNWITSLSALVFSPHTQCCYLQFLSRTIPSVMYTTSSFTPCWFIAESFNYFVREISLLSQSCTQYFFSQVWHIFHSKDCAGFSPEAILLMYSQGNVDSFTCNILHMLHLEIRLRNWGWLHWHLFVSIIYFSSHLWMYVRWVMNFKNQSKETGFGLMSVSDGWKQSSGAGTAFSSSMSRNNVGSSDLADPGGNAYLVLCCDVSRVRLSPFLQVIFIHSTSHILTNLNVKILCDILSYLISCVADISRTISFRCFFLYRERFTIVIYWLLSSKVIRSFLFWILFFFAYLHVCTIQSEAALISVYYSNTDWCIYGSTYWE